VRGFWFAGLDHVRIRKRRKWRIAGIFDRRRRWIGIRNFGWRKRRQIARRNAWLGRGRLGNLLPNTKFFQSEIPFVARRSRMINSVNAFSRGGFRKKRSRCLEPGKPRPR
jgi:hypothetical protein